MVEQCLKRGKPITTEGVELHMSMTATNTLESQANGNCDAAARKISHHQAPTESKVLKSQLNDKKKKSCSG